MLQNGRCQAVKSAHFMTSTIWHPKKEKKQEKKILSVKSQWLQGFQGQEGMNKQNADKF